MAVSSASTTSPRSSGTFPDHELDWVGLRTTEEVIESREDTLSSILGPDGEPLRYQSKKLGYIGFINLKERP